MLKGSHKIGRISHDNKETGEETADMERILELKKRHLSVYIEANRGGCFIFSCQSFALLRYEQIKLFKKNFNCLF